MYEFLYLSGLVNIRFCAKFPKQCVIQIDYLFVLCYAYIFGLYAEKATKNQILWPHDKIDK